jgi:hypothetical protein
MHREPLSCLISALVLGTFAVILQREQQRRTGAKCIRILDLQVVYVAQRQLQVSGLAYLLDQLEVGRSPALANHRIISSSAAVCSSSSTTSGATSSSDHEVMISCVNPEASG